MRGYVCTFLLQNGALWDISNALWDLWGGLFNPGEQLCLCIIMIWDTAVTENTCHLWNKTLVADELKLPLRWRHNGRDSVSNHLPHHCLLNRLFRRRSKKTSKLRVTGLCVGNSPGTGEFPAQMASNAEKVSIWWRHHAYWMVHAHGVNRIAYLTVLFISFP